MFVVAGIVGLALSAALLILVIQNTEEVSVEWLAWSVDAPHVVVLLIAIVGGVLLGVLLALLMRVRQSRRSHL